MKTFIKLVPFFVCIFCVLLLTGCTHQHVMSEWIVDQEATCKAAGSRHVECVDCGEIVLKDSIACQAHTPGEWVVDCDPLCEVEGSRHVACTVCGTTLETQPINCKNHKAGDWVIVSEATCSKEGSKKVSCIACETVLLTDVIPVKAHTAGAWIVDRQASCTADGEKHTECTVCGTTLMTDSIARKGHDVPAEWTVVTAATDKVEGLKNKKCTTCQTTLDTQIIPCDLMTTEELADYVRKRTVRILINGGEGIGTGFFIDDKGTLVTNFHVINGVVSSNNPQIDVELADGGRYSLSHIVKFDPAYDLAVLKINVSNVPYLVIDDENAVVGSNAYACGAALGWAVGNFTDGVISLPSLTYGLADCYLTTASISSGNSGGPLVNQYGEVIAVNKGTYTRGNDMYAAIKISDLNNLRYTGNKSLAEFVAWHNNEVQNSICAFEVDENLDLTGTYRFTYIHAYQTVTPAARCLYSLDFLLGGEYVDKIDGYDREYAYHAYRYSQAQYDRYTAYLRSEGFVYEAAISGRTESGGTIHQFYNEATGMWVELFVYTDSDYDDTLIRILAYYYE